MGSQAVVESLKYAGPGQTTRERLAFQPYVPLPQDTEQGPQTPV